MLNNIQNYDRFYAESSEHAYGTPNPIVRAVLDFTSHGTVLDIGAGDGRHAIFLAKHGFQVTALDTSAVALDKLEHLAAQQQVAVTTIQTDIARWSFENSYDVLIATSIFQHLHHNDALTLLETMKQCTNPQGIHAIALFTQEGDRYLLDRQEDPEAFYPASGWLRGFYQKWKVLHEERKEATLIRRNRADGTPMKSIVETLLIRKT